MAFDEEQLAQISNVNGFGLYRYDTLDSLGTVQANGYINNPDDHVGLVVGDLIDIFVWNTSIRFGTISVTERHVVNQVNAVGDVGLSSLATGQAIFASGQWGFWTAQGPTSNLVATGLLNNINTVDTTSAILFDAAGLAFRQTTAASITSRAYTRANNNMVALNSQPLLVYKFRLPQVTDVRTLVGMSPNTVPVNGDTPTDSVCLRFSTSVPDTNWKFYADIGGTPTVVDSGIPEDTDIHFLEIDALTASSVTLRLMDSSFIEQASTTFTTEVPASTTAMKVFAGCESQAAATKSFDHFFATILNRSP